MVSEANVISSEANVDFDELTLRETLTESTEPEERAKPKGEDWEAKYKEAEANRLALQKNLTNLQSKLSSQVSKSEFIALQEKIEELGALVQDSMEIALRTSEENLLEPEPAKSSRTPHYDAFKEEKAKKKAEEEKQAKEDIQTKADIETFREMASEAGIDLDDERLRKEVMLTSATPKHAILKLPKYLAKLETEKLEAKRKKEMEEQGLLEVSTGSAAAGVTRLSAQQRKVAREFGLTDEEYAAGLTMETAKRPIKK